MSTAEKITLRITLIMEKMPLPEITRANSGSAGWKPWKNTPAACWKDRPDSVKLSTTVTPRVSSSDCTMLRRNTSTSTTISASGSMNTRLMW